MTITAQNLMYDEIRINFSSPMSRQGLTTIENYTFVPNTVSVREIIVPQSEDEVINYVDVHVSTLTPGQTWSITVTNLTDSIGTPIGVQTTTLIAKLTKSDKIIHGFPSMYNTEVKSVLRQLLLAIGIADEQIGG